MSTWNLPESIVVGGIEYSIRADYRDILTVINHLEDESNPNWLRWRIAVAVFYDGIIPDEHAQEAMQKMADFIAYENDNNHPGPKLIDWEQDASAIVSGVNKVCGSEIRSMRFLHWWTFLGYFNEIGEGQLQTIVAIRDKKKRGKKLEKWEQEYYRDNKSKIDIQRKYTSDELEQMESMKKWL